MARRKPVSIKQRKAELQLKRAIKRGDAEPETRKPTPKGKARRRAATQDGPPRPAADREAIVESARRLQSAFVKLTPEYLQQTKELAGSLPLQRPIPASKGLYPLDLTVGSSSFNDPRREKYKIPLTCPKRPKWRFEMSKKEVESNEEGVHRKWLEHTDAVFEDWTANDTSASVYSISDHDSMNVVRDIKMPRSPSYFERNLEVWRQLWRVTEISQIVLVLLDSRCPLLHYPPSLAAYLAEHKTLRVILVLTKVDIAGIERAEAWTRYLQAQYPNVRIIRVEAYARETGAKQAAKGNLTHRPYLPSQFREDLVHAIKDAHEDLLRPPETIRLDEAKLKRWKSPVKKDIDWDNVLAANGGLVGTAVGGPAQVRTSSSNPVTDANHMETPSEFLTVGLIGQPNVGKSSLLNALFGAVKVRASRTPGKTKHFQTLFWSPDVRLVDCPGLVMPNFVPMETQVLAGILPISRISAIPACIHYAAGLLPLERIFGLEHPSILTEGTEDKRTWRDGRRQTSEEHPRRDPTWTAMDILTAYATAKGWVTAKAGRPDINRAGNAILRALAEARVPWAFWPPDRLLTSEDHGHGIWIYNSVANSSAWLYDENGDEASDCDIKGEADMTSESDGEDGDYSTGTDSVSETDNGAPEALTTPRARVGGMFAALAINEEEPETSGEGSEESDCDRN
ncbi:P-loop containing nucleoside triphosphate hydrolase protein [Punctularia strigosozonata HHB-11173 SS5]|uniref:P-loop containing nucleoside triphosphate hydrolase protein n=1 Tax=Punctularia strigosozonata (strain HHB-11173) TaxID=741275 RepID=UPI00044179B8|nr:P-loop containing nucleoside triphosphate hydrolase protein [Punctularia strigosozonata HHB-11173 SS5]EIN13953.1 P-loop containing nucleoside triphosphate hydrolase protein [Punctularia strigosozonata HHB-11173 SS5]